MQPEQSLLVGPWRVDPENVCVWRGVEATPLTPKAFAILRYLIEHPGRIITKDELFQALWPGTVVSDSALSVYISELRKVLGDAARAPQFIETVHRLGYRFIGPVLQPAPAFSPPPPPTPPMLVGRETELACLRHRRVLGATRERMLRELGETVERLASDCLLVLVLEDLHWSDAATLDVLAWLAQRREPARLLLIGTYRPIDVIVRAHPLRGLAQRLTAPRCIRLHRQIGAHLEAAYGRRPGNTLQN